MTDSEKLDLIFETLVGLDEKVAGLDEKVAGLDERVAGLEKDMIGMKAELKNLQHNDELILNEVERVHDILNVHMKDTSKHTA